MENKFSETIVGRFITLRKVELDDAEMIFKWRSGMSGRFLRQPENYTIESQRNWIKSRGDNEINYIITDNGSQEKVGTISIYDVNDFDKVADVGRLLLDDKFLVKSNPYGLEALLLCYGYVFNEMNFRKITGDISATNIAMFKLQCFLGMKEEGRLVKHTFIGNEYVDLHIMSLFKEDFDKTYQKKINFLLKSFN